MHFGREPAPHPIRRETAVLKKKGIYSRPIGEKENFTGLTGLFWNDMPWVLFSDPSTILNNPVNPVKSCEIPPERARQREWFSFPLALAPCFDSGLPTSPDVVNQIIGRSIVLVSSLLDLILADLDFAA